MSSRVCGIPRYVPKYLLSMQAYAGYAWDDPSSTLNLLSKHAGNSPTPIAASTLLVLSKPYNFPQYAVDQPTTMSGTGPESIPVSADPRSKRPTKKRALTPVSAQASHLDTLFARPDQEIRIPSSAATKRHLPLPPEIVTNVQGSSAGAGSGEFHVYKAARRREYERLRVMDAEVAEEEAQREFEKTRTAKEEEDRAKTERNRAKREKMKARKEKAKAGKKGDGKQPENAGAGAGVGAGGTGGGIKARVVEPSKGEEDGEANKDNNSKMELDTKAEEAVPAVADVDAPGLLIHDDD